MAIPLSCEKCRKTKNFKNLEQAEAKGWIEVKNQYGYNTWLCEKCREGK